MDNGKEVTVLTAIEAGRRLGISSAQVRRMATRHRVGTRITDRLWVFTASEVETLRSLRKPRGRPRAAPRPEVGRTSNPLNE